MLEPKGGRKRRIGKLTAAKQIADNFSGRGEKIKREAAIEFLRREEMDSGVLVGRGEGDLEFWHLSFQEYLAAEEIASKTDDPETGWWAKLKDNIDKPEWREVIIFVPACLNRLGEERVDLFFNYLGDSCVNQDITTKAKRAALGGCILRDLKVTGYNPSNSPSWLNILEEIKMIFEKDGQEIPLETRYEAAIAYGLGGDERIREFDKTWVPIPAGLFPMGAQNKNKNLPNYDLNAATWEMPVIDVFVPPFSIRKFPVTVEEFEKFVSDSGYEYEKYWKTPNSWEWRTSNNICEPLDWEEQLLIPNNPVSGISWYEANAYCCWLNDNELRDVEYRLPTEAEWEYAAKYRFEDEQLFPWGNDVMRGDQVEMNCAWSGLRTKTPVGMFPQCKTKDGIVDLFGNVEEWVLDNWCSSHNDRSRIGDMPLVDVSSPFHVVRGGSTIRFSLLCRATYRSRIFTEGRYETVGFRIVRIKNSEAANYSRNQSVKPIISPYLSNFSLSACGRVSFLWPHGKSKVPL